MATKLKDIVTRVRTRLMAPKAATATIKADRFWTDAELLEHVIDGCKSMWRDFARLHEEHFMLIDASGNVNIPTGGETILGVPADTFRVVLIEPLDITALGNDRLIKFVPAKYKSVEFTKARANDAIDPTGGGVIYYAMSRAGAPVNTVTIHVAPKLTGVLRLRFARVPVLPELNEDSYNPIPGESDLALIAWTEAHARAKERDDRSVDPNALAIYSTEKDNILAASSPRQEQAAIVLKGVFDDEEAEW